MGKMRNIFNADNWLWRQLGRLGDLVTLSLLWTVFSLPVLTLGPASAALYDAAVHAMRRNEETVIARFFSTFRRELKEGVVLTLLYAAVVLAAGALFYLVVSRLPAHTSRWPIYTIALYLLGFFLLCVLCWVWPTLSRFTLGVMALHGTALRLAFGHILRSAAMALLWGATLYAGLRYVAPFFVCPALAALLSTFLIEPVFRRYENK